MVLRPIDVCEAPQPAPPTPGSAWAAVAARQKQHSSAYWLISQPDHANLSGDLAANFVSPEFPHIDEPIARAIAVHDAGWAIFESEANPGERPVLNGDGKPLAFVDFPPAQFLRAWNASIDRAESMCPAGGIIASRHFCALGEFRLQNGVSDENARLITAFLGREAARQQRLRPACTYDDTELQRLLAVLQFCDLLSLYLCSGAQQPAEFPQKLTSRPVRIVRHQDFYRLDPSPFQPGGRERIVSLGVSARRYPPDGDTPATTLAFLLC